MASFVSLEALEGFFNDNPGQGDLIAGGYCYDVERDTAGTVTAVRQVDCADLRHKRPVTVAETDMGTFAVRAGHLSTFSGDGRPGAQINLADEQPSEGRQRITAMSGTGKPEDDLQAHVTTRRRNSGTGLEEDAEADAFVAEMGRSKPKKG